MENIVSVISIIISFVAILISIMTAKKQNKIALFELRYKCYAQLRTIRSFDSTIYDCDDANMIIKIFDMLWKTNLADKLGDECLVKSRCQMEQIANDVLQSEFLFRRKFDVDFADVLINTQKILMEASYGKVDKEAKIELHKLCELIEKKDIDYMKNKLKI